MVDDPYRQLEGGVACDVCGTRVTGARRAYFRFDGTGTRHWCCGATACLREFFDRNPEVYEVVDRKVTRSRWG